MRQSTAPEQSASPEAAEVEDDINPFLQSIYSRKQADSQAAPEQDFCVGRLRVNDSRVMALRMFWCLRQYFSRQQSLSLAVDAFENWWAQPSSGLPLQT